jgi:hypothetical protein
VSYVDGGLINNLPIEPIAKKCKTIIASHVNPLVEIPAPDSIFKVMERCFHLAINDNTMLKKKKCDVYIEPERLHHYKIFDFKKAPQLFDIGYEAAVKELKKHITKNKTSSDKHHLTTIILIVNITTNHFTISRSSSFFAAFNNFGSLSVFCFFTCFGVTDTLLFINSGTGF